MWPQFPHHGKTVTDLIVRLRYSDFHRFKVHRQTRQSRPPSTAIASPVTKSAADETR
jgi:hypothetical protein